MVLYLKLLSFFLFIFNDKCLFGCFCFFSECDIFEDIFIGCLFDFGWNLVCLLLMRRLILFIIIFLVFLFLKVMIMLNFFDLEDNFLVNLFSFL